MICVSIIGAIYAYEKKNKKYPDLIVLGPYEHSLLMNDYYQRDRSTLGYVTMDTDPSSFKLMGIKTVKCPEVSGVFFCEEPVLK